MAVTNITIVYNVSGAFETIKNYFNTPYPRQEKNPNFTTNYYFSILLDSMFCNYSQGNVIL